MFQSMSRFTFPALDLPARAFEIVVAEPRSDVCSIQSKRSSWCPLNHWCCGNVRHFTNLLVLWQLLVWTIPVLWWNWFHIAFALLLQRGFVTGGADKCVKFWEFELVKDESSVQKRWEKKPFWTAFSCSTRSYWRMLRLLLCTTRIAKD